MKKVTTIIPISPIEIVYLKKLCNSVDALFKSIDNGKGQFTSVQLKSSNEIHYKDMKYILSKFKEKYNKTLTFKRENSYGLFMYYIYCEV